MCATAVCFKLYPNRKFDIQVIISVYSLSFVFYAGIFYATWLRCAQC